MPERGSEKHQLLRDFAQNRRRSKLKAYAPFWTSFGTTIPGYIAAESSEAITSALERVPAHSELVIPLSVLMLGSGIGSAVQYLDLMRTNSTNGKIAQRVAQLEGRDPQTGREKRREINRVLRTVKIADKISPTAGNLFDLKLRHKWAHFRSKNRPESLEELAVADRKVRKWSIKYMGTDELGYQAEPEVLTDALIVADRQWEALVQDEKRPEYQRRYGALMKMEIQKRLSELPALEATQKPENQYEGLTPQQRDLELKELIMQFPDYADWRDNYDYNEREGSDEKKALFKKIELLLSTAPTTVAFREILLRELSLAYNLGIQHSGADVRQRADFLRSAGLDVEKLQTWKQDDRELLEGLGFAIDDVRRMQSVPVVPTLSEAIFKVIGLGPSADGSGESHLFDENNARETERRLFTYRKARNKELYGRMFGHMVHTPIERTWPWEYRAKYKQKLKPLN